MRVSELEREREKREGDGILPRVKIGNHTPVNLAWATQLAAAAAAAACKPRLLLFRFTRGIAFGGIDILTISFVR